MFEESRSHEDARRQIDEIGGVLTGMLSLGMDKLTWRGIRGGCAKSRELMALARYTGNPADMELATATFRDFHAEMVHREKPQP